MAAPEDEILTYRSGRVHILDRGACVRCPIEGRTRREHAGCRPPLDRRPVCPLARAHRAVRPMALSPLGPTRSVSLEGRAPSDRDLRGLPHRDRAPPRLGIECPCPERHPGIGRATPPSEADGSSARWPVRSRCARRPRREDGPPHLPSSTADRLTGRTESVEGEAEPSTGGRDDGPLTPSVLRAWAPSAPAFEDGGGGPRGAGTGDPPGTGRPRAGRLAPTRKTIGKRPGAFDRTAIGPDHERSDPGPG